MFYQSISECRVCGNTELKIYLDLGHLPLSNNLACSALDPVHDRKFPLQVLLCEECGLSQLSIVIEPEILFSNYVYRSSMSQGYVKHCADMAFYLSMKHHIAMCHTHFDIAGNDGALIEQFKRVIGCKSVNVDPAENLAPICRAKGIETFPHFFNPQTAEELRNRYGNADVITATNVVAHVHEIRNFIHAALNLLNPGGIFVIEFPYLVDFIEKKEFDTIYFEHLSYLSLFPIRSIVQEVGHNIIDADIIDIHGGSVRLTIGKGMECELAGRLIKEEVKNYHKIDRYDKFARDVDNTVYNFKNGIKALGKKKVAAFAASAKGNTLLNVSKITPNEIKYIIDQTPEKIGKYSPGTRIPIVPLEHISVDPPDYIVILSWNFADEIKKKLREYGYTGYFIIPIPNFKIVY